MTYGLCFHIESWEKAILFLQSLRHDNDNINEAERLQGALSLGVCLMVNI